MDANGVFLWVTLCAVRPKGMVGHRNEAWGGGTGGRCGKGFACCARKIHIKTTMHNRGTDERGVVGWANESCVMA